MQLDMSDRDRLRFVIVNSFTGLNLFIGLLALGAAAAGYMAVAAWGLLLCAFLDGCDGTLARRWEVESDFGAQLDSLADMTSFIIAAGALAYYWAIPTETPIPLIVTIGASGLFVLAGAIRLARFNSTTTQPGFFQGMPTTTVATIVAVNYLVYPAMNSYWIIAMVTTLGMLMVSILPYPKFSSLIRHVPKWFWPVAAIAAAISFSWTLWVLTIGYLMLGPAISIRRRYIGRSR